MRLTFLELFDESETLLVISTQRLFHIIKLASRERISTWAVGRRIKMVNNDKIEPNNKNFEPSLFFKFAIRKVIDRNL